jgi:hypothetical protein
MARPAESLLILSGGWQVRRRVVDTLGVCQPVASPRKEIRLNLRKLGDGGGTNSREAGYHDVEPGERL